MVRLTDPVDMTIAVDWDVKPQNNRMSEMMSEMYTFEYHHEIIACGSLTDCLKYQSLFMSVK